MPPWTKNSILEFNNKESVSDVFGELLRNGAQQLIHQTVETELREYFSQYQRLSEDGRDPLVRYGYWTKRIILTGMGPSSEASLQTDSNGLFPQISLQLSLKPDKSSSP